MTSHVWRLFVICTAWSLGAVLVVLAEAPGLDTIVPALFAAAAYVMTRDVYGGRGSGGSGGNVKYWRGRRADDDQRRWH